MEKDDLIEIVSKVDQIINLDSKIDKNHPTPPLFEDEELEPCHTLKIEE